MTEDTGFPSQPDQPPVTREQANEEVAAQLGAAAPGPGVSGEQLGAQMHAAGATAGLPYEDAMNAAMEQIKALSQQVQTLQQRDYQREQAQILALGEPVLQRYANGVRDKLAAHRAANPGTDDHFAQPIRDAAALADAAANAISRGANDLGTVRAYASRLDHFFARGHARTASGPVRHADLSAAASDLEHVITEANRLAPPGGQPPGVMTPGRVLTAG